MRLTYEAIDETGKEVTDQIEASSAADATETLLGLGLTVTTISEARRGRVATASSHKVRGQPRRLKNLSLMARQLAVLIRTGTPLADALGAIARQLPVGPWRNVVSDVHEQVEGGSTLSEGFTPTMITRSRRVAAPQSDASNKTGPLRSYCGDI